METIINWLNGLSKQAKIALLVAVAIFTPAVGILFSIVFSGIGAIFTVLGFVLGFVNWGVAFLLALAFGGYKAYRFVQDNGSMDEDEYCSRCGKYDSGCNCYLGIWGEEDESSWDPFR